MHKQTTADLSHAAAPVYMPPLRAGDHLDRETFHRRYECMPPDFRAELIEGVVIVPSPLSRGHGKHHANVTGWAAAYCAATPGTEALDNATTFLSKSSEPQPDVILMVLPEFGGQARHEGDYIGGAPELIVEVAYSSEDYDAHSKLRDYQRAGVQEYVLMMLRADRILWHRLRGKKFESLAPDASGIFRSEVFPGLWLDSAAVLRGDLAQVLETLKQGLAQPEHAAFVDQLRRGRC